MKRKLAVARALMHRPDLVFLDEPTSGLDPVATVQLREDLAHLVRQHGVTIFLSTHNLAEAERLCDRVGVIREGRLLADGSVAELRRRSGGDVVRITVRNLTPAVSEVASAHPDVAASVVQGEVLTVTLRAGVDGVSGVVGALVRADAGIEEVHKMDRSLEDVFLGLMREGST